MGLDAEALVEVLRWRGERVFAVASQIFFSDPQRRREETGWTDFRVRRGRLELYDAEPDPEPIVRGHLYAGGGASLFRRSVLAAVWADDDPYAPFYWEDVEWGLRAIREGFEVLFCPTSRAVHRHRATIARWFPANEVDRVFARNGVQFALRNPLPRLGPLRLLRMVAGLPARSRRELLAPDNVRRALAARAAAFSAPCAEAPVCWLRRKYFLQPDGDRDPRPLVVVVTPYAIYPPRHGGAVRLHRLLRELAARFRIVLLSDEENLYAADSVPCFAPLAMVHLVSGRKERFWQRGRRTSRIRTHSHRALAGELQRLIAVHQPALVDVEFVELAALARDVTLSGRSRPDRADRFELRWLARHDALVACSEEDAELLRAVPDSRAGAVRVVPNGIDATDAYRPSVATGPRILFLGPFRYRPNLDGICTFLERVFPALRAQVHGVELLVLGGTSATVVARQHRCFAQPGVRVIDFVHDARPFLDESAVSINPLLGIRGSSVKLVESIAAGRVCVSTTAGARGFLDAGFPGLVTVPRIEDFAAPLVRLLGDVEHRLALERPPLQQLQAFAWTRCASALAECWREQIARGART
jgi:glycosyltransferase involved in cell wall biosynthesis